MKKLIILTLLALAVNASAQDIVARVIYSEASSICSSRERWLVASVIKNRIHNIGFALGKLNSMEDVVKQSNAFSCINDKTNSNWNAYLTVNNSAKKLAKKLATVDFTPLADIVYYHDKSISKPKGWDNRYWTAVKVIETKHFIFYKITKTKTK